MLEHILAYQMPHTNKNIAVQLFNFCIAMKKEGYAKGYLTDLIYEKTNFINCIKPVFDQDLFFKLAF